MCDTCGCNEIGGSGSSVGRPLHFIPTPEKDEKQHRHHYQHCHPHEQLKDQREVMVTENVLKHNNLVAQENKRFFNDRNILALNIMGSPGSGKTTFIIQTIEALIDKQKVYVIEGDQFGSLDTERIDKTDAKVIQVNTGNGCHLDAMSVMTAVKELNPANNSLVIIENVGNLVCPALFDLGEHQRVVIFSVTEGDDKPIKYAPMFHEASICIINKTDLLQLVPFDHLTAINNLRKVNHHLRIISLSALQGSGMTEWIAYLKKSMNSLQS